MLEPAPSDPPIPDAHAIVTLLRRVGVVAYAGTITPDGAYHETLQSGGDDVLLGGSIPPGADVGVEWKRCVHPDDRDAYSSLMRAMAAGEVRELTYRLIGYDGRTRWVRDHAYPRWEGDTLIIEGLIVDVTHEMDGASEARRTLIVESALRSIEDYIYAWVTDKDGARPIFENSGGRGFLGEEADAGLSYVDAAELWRSRVHPDDRATYDAVMADQANGVGGSAEYRLVRPDDSIVYVYDRWRGQVLEEGALAEGIISDVTALKHAEAALRASEEQFRGLASSAPVGIYVATADGRLSYVNERWTEMHGLQGNEALAHGWLSSVHPDDRERAAAGWRTAVAAGDPYEDRFRVVHAGGDVRWLVSRGRPVRGAGAELIGYVGTDDDVTEQLASQHALERLSGTDTLTGLANRRRFSENLAAALAAGGRPAVVLIDVDHFKAVNDTHGHATGDEVLVEIARRLADAARRDDCVARWGGEEFAILFSHVPHEKHLRERAEAVRLRVGDTPIDARAVRLRLTASAGAALWDGRVNADVLLGAADEALYAAKGAGRDVLALVGDEVVGGDIGSESPLIVLARGISRAAALREGVGREHAGEVAELAARIALRLGLPRTTVLACRLGGWLHDVGKISLPDRVLLKPGPLSEEDWALMRTHAMVGAGLVGGVPGLEIAVSVVRHHHERWDGAGYPDGLFGPAIPIEARIVAASDAFSAMTDDRVYRSGRTTAAALREVRRSSGSHFDPEVAAALCEEVSRMLAQERGAA